MNRGWLTTAAGTAINLTLGVLYAWSVFKGTLRSELGITDFQASLPYAVAMGMISLTMVPAGRIQDRFGPRMVVTAGGALMGTGLILSSLTNSVSMLVLTFGIMTGMGIGLGYSAVTPAAVKWFPPAMKGTIIGIVVSGFGLAPVYISPLAKWLLASYGAQTSFLILGVIFLVLTLGLSQLVSNPPKGYVPASAAPSPTGGPVLPPKAKRDYDWPEMVRTPQFYLLWAMLAAGSTGGLMIIGHLATYAKSIGIEAGALLVAVLAVFNAGGRITGGLLSDKVGLTRTMLLVFLLHAATLIILPFMTSFALLTLATILMGFCYGSYLSLYPSATYAYFGTRHGGINYGLVFTAWGLGGVFGAPLAGYIKDATGSYTLAFYIAAGLCVVAALLSLVTKPPVAEPKAEAEAAD